MECCLLSENLLEDSWRAGNDQHETLTTQESAEAFVVTVPPPRENLLHIVDQQQNSLVPFVVVTRQALETAAAYGSIILPRQVRRQLPERLKRVLLTQFGDNVEQEIGE